jgi:hypothetical protein
MSNPTGEVQLKAGEKTYIFRLCNLTLIRLQHSPELKYEGTDEDFLNWLGDKFERLSPDAWGAVAFYGLQRRQPDITFEEANDVLFAVGSHAFVEAFVQALKWALPDAPKTKEKEKGAAPKGKGGAPSAGATS